MTITLTDSALRLARAKAGPQQCTHVEVIGPVLLACRNDGVEMCLECWLWACGRHVERGVCVSCRGTVKP